jgi:hypothetical protein
MKSEVVMPGISLNLKLEEMPGNQFQNLEDAKSIALKTTTADSLKTIRALLESGVLIVENGKVVPDPDKKPKEEKNRLSTAGLHYTQRGASA